MLVIKVVKIVVYCIKKCVVEGFCKRGVLGLVEFSSKGLIIFDIDGRKVFKRDFRLEKVFV